MFSNKTLLVAGGNGSFGNAVLRRFIGDVREPRSVAASRNLEGTATTICGTRYGKFVEVGEQRNTASSHGEDYNSHNTTRLDVEGMKALLLKLSFMQRIARGERAVAEE
jgi:hypothetical protein